MNGQISQEEQARIRQLAQERDQDREKKRLQDLADRKFVGDIEYWGHSDEKTLNRVLENFHNPMFLKQMDAVTNDNFRLSTKNMLCLAAQVEAWNRQHPESEAIDLCSFNASDKWGKKSFSSAPVTVLPAYDEPLIYLTPKMSFEYEKDENGLVKKNRDGEPVLALGPDGKKIEHINIRATFVYDVSQTSARPLWMRRDLPIEPDLEKKDLERLGAVLAARFGVSAPRLSGRDPYVDFTDATYSVMREAGRPHFEAAGVARAMASACNLRQGEIEQIAALKLNPEPVPAADHFESVKHRVADLDFSRRLYTRIMQDLPVMQLLGVAPERQIWLRPLDALSQPGPAHLAAHEERIPQRDRGDFGGRDERQPRRDQGMRF